MRLDVFFTPGEVKPADVTGRVVAVIDVLRASTSIAVALANDAKGVIPFESADDAMTRAKQFEKGEVVLAGEQKMIPISGFSLGNSPQSFTAEAVGGQTVLITTTNGTKALLGVQGAREVVVASYVNFSAVLAMLRAAARANADITIVCAGNEGNFSLEDSACAGRYVRAIPKRLASVVLNDAATASALIDRRYADNIEKVFKDSTHGQALAAAGFEADLAVAASVDSFPVVPIFQDRQITRLGPERDR
ncbi:MAG: 2-phosphosulfolactate phosphatase [Gemmatimonadaceae bacterium]|nr:2-phosphosulfolactate phosphatase [Gemmatimonadaceae bacterium]